MTRNNRPIQSIPRLSNPIQNHTKWENTRPTAPQNRELIWNRRNVFVTLYGPDKMYGWQNPVL